MSDEIKNKAVEAETLVQEVTAVALPEPTGEVISLEGAVSPGPAYKLYLSPDFVETEAVFLARKSEMALVGDVKTFENFIVVVPPSVDPDAYNTVIVWCESFEEFFTAARYR